MANGDAWDAITMRIAFVAAADAVTARRPRGRRSGEAVIVVRTRPFVAFSTLMVWVLRMWAGRQVVGGGGRQRLEYRLYASPVAICRRHLRPPCPLSPPRASLRSFLAIVQRGALRRKNEH